MVLAGNVALESMGFETFGFAGGREDVWEPDEDVYWGPETTWLGDERYTGDRELENPLAAVQMGLIYVNPEGPNGNPDPLAAARDIRETFRRMAMNDEETVALIAGGHTFGKTHGAADPDEYVGPEPEGAPLEEQGLGWRNTYGTGKGADAITSGLEVTWTTHPDAWDNSFFENLFGYEWELTKSPAGAHQWKPKDGAEARPCRTPTTRCERHAPTMLTTDLALRFDPVYEPISRRFLEHPDELADAFARAWFKLTHRDMGPIARYLGPEVPAEDADLAGPGPARSTHELDRRRGRRRAQGADPRLGAVGLPAGLHRVGVGLDVPRQRQARRRQRRAASASSRSAAGRSTSPTSWRTVLSTLEGIQEAFNAAQTGGKQVSLADLIVLGGCAAVEQAAKERRPRRRGAVHAGPHRRARRSRPTSSPSPRSSRPRTGSATTCGKGHRLPAEYLLVDRANLLTLSAPEMTVLVGGLRVLGANSKRSAAGRPHRDARVADQRLLRQPARPGHDVEADVRGRGDLRGPRRRHGRAQVDRQPRRPRLRLELRAAGARRGLRERRRAGEVRARLRRRVGQGHEPRPVRPRLISMPRSSTYRMTTWASSALQSL